MKKLLSILIALAMVFALASCGGEKENDKKDKETVNKQEVVTSTEEEMEEISEENEEKEEVKEENKKPSEDKKEDKVPPATDDNKAPAQSQPANPPKEEESAPQSKTVGYTLADTFKANASSDLNSIANKLIADSSLSPIAQSLGTMEIEEGYLTGFDNEEIKGFKKGVMFAPMMGTIPFVGYVFELASANDADAFTAKLQACSNLRWNICTSADEKVVLSVGNKVFFVMSPLSFEE